MTSLCLLWIERLRSRCTSIQKSSTSRRALCRPTRLTGIAVAAALAFTGRDAGAGPITASYLAAGVQAPTLSTTCGSATKCYVGTETFTNWAGGDFTSTFQTGTNNFDANNYIKGVYTANGDTNWSRSAANQYGGANGTAAYPELFGNTSPGDAYVIRLSTSASIPGVNYFGIWISALDASNDLQFYSGGKLLYSFGATDLQTALGTCSASNAYCGNPTTPFKGQNSSEAYAYVNFFDTVGYFDTVVLYNTTSSGFESSNHAVGYINPIVVSGTTFTTTDRPPSSAANAKFAGIVAIPEPATVVLVFSALMVVTFRHRRHQASQTTAGRGLAEGAQPRKKRKRKRRSRPAQFGWPAVARSRFST